MRKTAILIGISFFMIALSLKSPAEKPSMASFLGISISFSTHSYWDGESKSCLPRAKGWCLHFEMDAKAPATDGAIRGEVSNTATMGLSLSFNKKTGITPDMFSKLFRNGRFFLEGEVTMPEDLARKLELPTSFTIPEGYYNYKENGDIVTLFFRK
jgi:hypothetical protein